MRRIHLIAGLAMSVLSPIAQLTAQNHPDNSLPGFTPVVIALSDELPAQSGDIVIVRRASGSDHDVILVRPGHVSPATLAAAVGTLQAARAHLGDVPTSNMLIRVPLGGGPRSRAKEAANWVDRLNKSDPNRQPAIDGLGRRRYVRVFLPNHVAVH